jgi:pimeloyl-ACP methyl ester carboxylesterase
MVQLKWLATLVLFVGFMLFGLTSFVASTALAASEGTLVTQDNFVKHVSTVQANAGSPVGIFVRQKVLASKLGRKTPVVLFVHGGTVPGVPAYDLEYKDYNWMAHLARAGFNAYTMDLTGYGGSPKPMMDDPCNVDPKQQDIIKDRPLKTACAPNYPYQMNTIRDDWAEIDTVVEHLRKVNGVKRINIIGWSAGGPRVGGYIAQHPEKIERAMLYAPSPPIDGAVPDKPASGAPMRLQTREDLEKKRWDPDVRCQNQVEPGVRDAVWTEIMKWDKVGSTWGPEGIGVMRATIATRFGWTKDLTSKVVTPTLIVVGEHDRPDKRRVVYDQISSKGKVFVNVACASHFMVWEKQHHVLHATSVEWFTHGHVQNVNRGEFRVEEDGTYKSVGGAVK